MQSRLNLIPQKIHVVNTSLASVHFKCCRTNGIKRTMENLNLTLKRNQLQDDQQVRVHSKSKLFTSYHSECLPTLMSFGGNYWQLVLPTVVPCTTAPNVFQLLPVKIQRRCAQMHPFIWLIVCSNETVNTCSVKTAREFFRWQKTSCSPERHEVLAFINANARFRPHRLVRGQSALRSASAKACLAPYRALALDAVGPGVRLVVLANCDVDRACSRTDCMLYFVWLMISYQRHSIV